ncbi:hypothetical protein BaRGS_00039708 [Batillaria attramentaria]|uniref:Peptidase M12B domain-containing protein n=1 Tax=Batillaria attramentaria TaxID=370345 RepID=A0ABD0J260_9CAEN
MKFLLLSLRLSSLLMTISVLVTVTVPRCVYCRETEIVYGRVSQFNKTEGSGLPPFYAMDLTVNGSNVHVNLTRRSDVTPNIPLYTLNNNYNGKQTIQRRNANNTKEFAIYQDQQHGAIFAVAKGRDQQGRPQFNIEGVLHSHGKVFDVRSTRRQNPRQRHRYPRNANSDDLENANNNSLNNTDRVFQGVQVKNVTGLHEQHTSRRKRAITQDVYIDVVALVDFAAYKYTETTEWEKQQDALNNIRQYYALVISGVDLLYKSIDALGVLGYTIHVRLSDIIVATCGLSSLWTEQLRTPQDTVDGDLALGNLTDWAANTDLLLTYDHLMLFTGYDLTMEEPSGPNTGLLGLAWLGTACETSGYASSIVEDLGGFECIGTAAHELGHGLFAYHDGAANSCDSIDRYVMAEYAIGSQTPQDELNPWSFSTCSAQYFDDYFVTLLSTSRGQQCLYNSLAVDGDVPDVSSQMPGQLYDVDEQCRLIYGTDSYFCRTVIICYNEWCVGGECVYDSAAPSVPANCTFGDFVPGPIFGSADCPTHVVNFPTDCVDYDVVNEYCCHSCGSGTFRRKRSKCRAL